MIIIAKAHKWTISYFQWIKPLPKNCLYSVALPFNCLTWIKCLTSLPKASRNTCFLFIPSDSTRVTCGSPCSHTHFQLTNFGGFHNRAFSKKMLWPLQYFQSESDWLSPNTPKTYNINRKRQGHTSRKTLAHCRKFCPTNTFASYTVHLLLDTIQVYKYLLTVYIRDSVYRIPAQLQSDRSNHQPALASRDRKLPQASLMACYPVYWISRWCWTSRKSLIDSRGVGAS